MYNTMQYGTYRDNEYPGEDGPHSVVMTMRGFRADTG